MIRFLLIIAKDYNEGSLFIKYESLIDKINNKNMFNVEPYLNTFREKAEECTDIKKKEDIGIITNYFGSKRVLAVTPKEEDNDNSNHRRVEDVCKNILEKIQEFEEVKCLKLLYNKLKGVYESGEEKGLENAIIEFKTKSELICKSDEQCNNIKKSKEPFSFYDFEPNPKQFDFMTFFEKHELEKYRTTIRNLNTIISNDTVITNKSVELKNKDVFLELVKTFDELMIYSMFGYYAYYEEVKKEIMSFINFFTEAAAKKERKKAQELLEEERKKAQELLEKKDKLLKEYEERIKLLEKEGKKD